MKLTVLNLIVLSMIMINFCGCEENSKTQNELKRVTIKYTNGSIYCEGFHYVNKTGEPKNRVGIWKFYYPTGALETFLQYNEEGELINEKDYNEEGKVTYSQVVNGNI